MLARARPVNRGQRGTLDRRTWAGWLGGSLLMGAGAVVLVLSAFIPDSDGAGLEPLAGLLTILIGSTAFVLPWKRLDERVQLVYPVSGLAVLTVAVIVGGGTLDYYVAVYPVPFIYVGVTQRPAMVVALGPVALASILTVGAFGGWSAVAVTNLAMALPLSVVIGELLAVGHLRQQRAERSVARLLQGVRSLNRAGHEEDAAEVIAALGAALSDADVGVSFLLERVRADRHVVRAVAGHPSVAGRVSFELAVEDDGTSALLRAGTPVMLPELGGQGPWADHLVAALAVRSAFLVPLVGRPGVLGVLALLWRGARARVPAGTRYELELLAEEAGRAIERIRSTERLAREAQTDALTSLANRRSYARALDRIQPGDAVVIVDLDRFKLVNDREGHDAGDEVLRTMADCLRGVARGGDCVARYGGEEFALVFAGAGAGGARAAMDRAKQAWEQRSGATTFSAGIAVALPDEAPDETLRRADVALYAAKAAGRDRIEVAPARAVAS